MRDDGASPTFADEAVERWLARAPSGFTQFDVAAMRAAVAERARSRPPGPDLDEVRDVMVGSLPARLYRPSAAPVPLVVYLHGGGWTIGGVDSFDRLCRRVADGSGAAVLFLDYRLAPEHPWPAAVDDTVAALRWVAQRPPDLGRVTGRVAVAGDSAGGTLVALACIRLRDEESGLLPDLQVLVYANTDLADEHPSMRTKGSGFGLDVEAIRFFNRQWVPDASQWTDPAVSPLRTPDLSGLPAAVVVTAEHDPLRDQAEAFARRLADAVVEVELRREPGLIHNFMLLDEVSPACAAAADRVAGDLRRRLAPIPRR
jgi:acetyl esterase